MEHTPKNILIKAIKEKVSKDSLEKNIVNTEDLKLI